MNIIVCIKQVPSTTNVEIDPKTGTLKREGVDSIINPFDEYAIEEGIRIKERIPNSKVTVITMGPPQAEAVLRDALSRGADEAVLVSDRAFAGADTLATSYTLSSTIKKIGQYDLIICGKQATDGDTAQVGPGIAEKLDIPHVAYVRKIEQISTNSIKVERMMEDGYDVIEMSLPALITVVKEINVPRLPSLKGMIFAKKAQIKKFNVDTLDIDKNKIGIVGSPTNVMKIFSPSVRKGGEKITGSTPQEIASKFVSKLKEHKIIL